MAAASVRWVRIDLGWPNLESRRGQHDTWYLDRADRVVDAAHARGFKVLATLWGTPSWANGGLGVAIPPSDVADYARVARWAAAHFDGRVDAWQVWNEPTHPDYWLGTPSQYAALLRAAYPAFKAGDPGAVVVFGGVVHNDDVWIERVYAAGAKGSFDAMATQPYQAPIDLPPETPDNGTIYRLTHVTAVRDVMVRYGDANKPIWFTEFGWSSHPNYGGEPNWERGVTLAQQADYLLRTIKFVAAKYPYVTHVFWYNERNNGTSNTQYDNYGLLYRDFTAKPAYFALKRFLTTRIGTVGVDVLIGTRVDERFRALAGSDIVYARGGSDSLYGGAGADRLHGQAAGDIVYGGRGRDRLAGGGGNDSLFGRDGYRDLVSCGSGRDRAVLDRFDAVVGGCEMVAR